MLPKRERIQKGSEIRGILKRKQIHFSSPLLYLVAELNGCEFSRIAVVCRRQIGSSVKRNRTKRVVLAAYARISHKIEEKLDVVVVPKSAIERIKPVEDVFLKSGICE